MTRSFFHIGDPVHHRMAPTQMRGHIVALITTRKGFRLYRVRWSSDQTSLHPMGDLGYGL